MTAQSQTLAVLFPGQGVGAPSDAELVGAVRPDLLELARELTGDDPFERIGDGTRFAQPAIYCTSLAGFEQLGRPRGIAFAGHSLGEIAALAAAGAVDSVDGLRLAAERGRLMQEAAEGAEPGGMLAVGGDREAALALAGAAGLALANENSPEQFVLSGPEDALEAARSQARERGLRVKRLAVAGAFHSSDMEPAVEPFAARLSQMEFGEPVAPVLSGATASAFDADPRPQLVASLTNPVRWVEVMRALERDGANRFIDVGPGRVLAKLVPRVLDGAEVDPARKETIRV